MPDKKGSGWHENVADRIFEIDDPKLEALAKAWPNKSVIESDAARAYRIVHEQMTKILDLQKGSPGLSAKSLVIALATSCRSRIRLESEADVLLGRPLTCTPGARCVTEVHGRCEKCQHEFTPGDPIIENAEVPFWLCPCGSPVVIEE